MPSSPVLLVHGYSDSGTAFGPWREKLTALGFDPRTIQVADWRSLSDELTLADLAEGFERAVQARRDIPPDAPLQIVAHSAGALVVRAWLAAHPAQRQRVTHFVGLGPAHFGSPLAHKGSKAWSVAGATTARSASVARNHPRANLRSFRRAAIWDRLDSMAGCTEEMSVPFKPPKGHKENRRPLYFIPQAVETT